MFPKVVKNVTLARESALHMAAFCASANLRRAARVVTRHYNQSLRASGITAAQLPILATVASNPEITVGHVAKIVDIERSAISREISLLERKGMLASAPGRDRRMQTLRVTSKGQKVLVRAFDAWRHAHSELLSVVSEEDLGSMLEQVRRIGRAAKSLGSGRTRAR